MNFKAGAIVMCSPAVAMLPVQTACQDDPGLGIVETASARWWYAW